MNPIYGSVGLLWSGSWQLCQAAVEAVLKGAPITPITSEAAASGRGPPLKAYDIRHVSKDENSAASNETQQQRVKTRSRVKKSSSSVAAAKPKEKSNNNNNKGTETGSSEPDASRFKRPWTGCCATEEVMNRSASHESSLSHQSEEVVAAAEGESKESESMVSVETSILFRDEPESNPKRSDRTDESLGEPVGLELTLGFEPASRAYHVVPVKKRRVELRDCGVGSGENGSCKMELGLEFPV